MAAVVTLSPPTSALGPRPAPVVAVRDAGHLPSVTLPTNYLKRKFLLFAPFCDQGLGVQARAYLGWLGELGYGACVFASASSKAAARAGATPDRFQAAPSEWEPPEGVDVQYSPQTRERVQPQEVAAYATEQGVTDALILEPAHLNCFRVAAALYAQTECRVWAVPNLEMVRREELVVKQYYDKEVFAGVLCHNDYAVETLRYFRPLLVDRIKVLPFALPATEPWLGGPVPLSTPYDGYGPLRFLLVGGLNAVVRKQADKVCAAFARAGGNATLTVLTQKPEPSLLRFSRDQRYRIVAKHFSHEHILQAYATHHVVLFLSRAEGIGLAMHEALRAGCAMVTLKHRMYTHMVCDGVTGRVVAAVKEAGKSGAKAIGNDDPVVHTYTFDVDALATVLGDLMRHPQQVASMQLRARQSFETVFAPSQVTKAWRSALRVNAESGRPEPMEPGARSKFDLQPGFRG